MPRKFNSATGYTAVLSICLFVGMLVSYLIGSSPHFVKGQTGSNSDVADSSGYTIAIDGKAFLVSETDEGVKLSQIKTALPVFKAFGLSASKTRILYRPLNEGRPSGDLFVEDLTTGEARKVSDQLVLVAAWSPTNESEVAYTFSSGSTFGLAVADLTSEDNRVIVPEQVFAEPIQWSDSGAEIYYFQETFREQITQDNQGEGSQTTELSLRLVPTTSGQSQEVSTRNLPKGFLAPQQQQYKNQGRFTAMVYNDSFEVSVDNIAESGVIYVRAISSDEAKPVAEGRLLQILSKGIISRAYDGSKTVYQYTTFEGATSLLGTVVAVSYNLPIKNFTLTQGGERYPSPGNCRISSHTSTSTSGYAYDMQGAIGAHILAAADGLVVRRSSSVNCNRTDTVGCGDYRGDCSSRDNGGWGNYIIIEHSDGNWTKYNHLEYESLQAPINTQVCQGRYLANQGHTGITCCNLNGCGDHLHFQLQESSDLNARSKRIDFAEPQNPLTCLNQYTSRSTEVSSCGSLKLVASLTFDPSKSTYRIGETVRGRFTIKNEGATAVTLDELTIGGRRSGNPPSITDFPHDTSIFIPSGSSYEYDDRFTFRDAGDYTFFPAYRIGSNWVTSEDDRIPFNPGVIRKLNVRAENLPGIQLVSGWNLISLPLQPSDTRITGVLSSISGKYVGVWAYNRSINDFDAYFPGIGGPLSTMEAGRGYWIYMRSAETLQVAGSSPSKTTRLLNGWNLAGYNNLTSLNIRDALSSISGKYVGVWAYNRSINDFDAYFPGIGGPLSTLEPGRGYWIYANQDTDWRLP